MIQSAQHSNEYCIHCTNEWLVATKKLVDEITDEDFELAKGSVNTNISEKDINLTKVHTRSWGQISTHQYKFKKQQESIEMLKNVTKADFIKCFNEVFFSDKTKRVDFELDSKCKEEIPKENTEYEAKNQEHEVFKPAGGRGASTDLDSFMKNVPYHDDAVLERYKKFKA